MFLDRQKMPLKTTQCFISDIFLLNKIVLGLVCGPQIHFFVRENATKNKKLLETAALKRTTAHLCYSLFILSNNQRVFLFFIKYFSIFIIFSMFFKRRENKEGKTTMKFY